MAWQWPAFFANMQHSRFSSSEPVTAMNTSASSIPASDRVVMDEPLPTMPITSYDSLRCSTRALFVSMTVTLWSSSLSCRASAVPTLPPPTRMILIEKNPFFFFLCRKSHIKGKYKLSIAYFTR